MTQNNTQIAPDIKAMLSQFAGIDIFTELGLANASDEVKAQMLESMLELAEKRLLDRMLTQLTDEQRAQLAQLHGTVSDQALFQQMAEYVPNLPEMVVEEMEEVKKIVRESMSGAA